MALTSSAIIHLQNGEQLVVSSSKSPMTEAIRDIQYKIIIELDHAFSDWDKVQITIVKVK